MSRAHQSHLLAKQAAYESLSIHLTKLPRKLTYPGLIPIAPRLYLPGQLVRTNEILVLLGRSGEASYFAERTAWQAHQIVRRRLGHLEQGLRELLAAAEEVKVLHIQPSAPKKRVTFRDPVVCASPPLKARPRISPSSTFPPLSDTPDSPRDPELKLSQNSFDHSQGNSTIHHANNRLPPEMSPSLQALESQYQSVNTIPEEYMNVLRAAELDEDSSDDDLEQDYGSDDEQHFSRFVSPSPHAKPELEPLQTSETLDKTDIESRNIPTVPQEKEVSHPNNPNPMTAQSVVQQEEHHPTEHHIRTELQDALRNAEIRAREDGVVNLMEFYDEGSSIPSKATLPSHFQPDNSIDFENDDEAYLDVTGRATGKSGTDSQGPTDHLNFLREEADKEENEERMKAIESARSVSAKRQNKLEKEKKEFGSGFAKGFFGAGSTSSTGSKRMQEQGHDELPGSHVKDPTVSELQETAPIEETVVERKVSRKSSSRHRKARTPEIPQIMSMAGKEEDVEEHEMERAGHFTHIEDPHASEKPAISRFKQLRQLQKVSADDNPVR